MCLRPTSRGSSSKLELKRRVTREKGVTRLDDANPKNARRVGPKCSGPSLHERTGSVKNSAVSATAGVTPSGLGSKCLPPDASQRPIHKKDMTRDNCCTPHLHHILCNAHTYTRVTARRDSSSSLRTARHVQAQRESRVTTQHLRGSLCQNTSTNFPDLPPWCANCVGASQSAEGKCLPPT